MNGIDYAVSGVLLISLLIGLWRGFVHEALSLAGIPLAFVLSKMYVAELAQLMPMSEENTRLMVAFAVLFIMTMLVWGVLAWMIARVIKAAGLGWPDSVLGALFGLVRGVFVVLALVWLAGMTYFPERPFWREAQMSRTLEDVALLTKTWLPGDIAQRIHYGARS
jgi:membrane protein required for colicin V production